MYHIWEFYEAGSGYAFVEKCDGLTYDQQRATRNGESLDNPLPRVTITELTPGEIGDLIGTYWGAYIMSASLQTILASEPIQFIPAHLRQKPDVEYTICNVLSLLPLFDFKHSRFTSFEDDPSSIYTIQKLVLKPIPPDAPGIFRLAEVPPIVLVDDELRKMMQEASSSAGKFTPVSKFTYG